MDLFLKNGKDEFLRTSKRSLSILFIVFIFFKYVSAQDFTLEKLPASVNSMYDEISPVVSRDGRTLFYTKIGDPGFDKNLKLGQADFSGLVGTAYENQLAVVYSEIAGNPISNPVQSDFNQDVWMAEIGEQGQVENVQHPDYPLNSALPNSIVAITPDPNRFVVINRFDEKGYMQRGFSTVERTSDRWTMPKAMEIEDFYTLTSEVSLTMSFDGQILILSAIRRGAQDMDLYMCRRQSDGTWSSPKHLGYKVNSPDRETTPFLSEDNETLFFSSNRYNAQGGNDIFMSRRLDESWQNWATPKRLTEPINSAADDSQPYFNMTTGYLYFTSKRDGNSDIFRVKIAPPQPTEIVVKGRVLNGKTGEVIPSAAVYYGAKDNPKNSVPTINGEYALSVPRGVAFELTPEKPAYTGQVSDVFFKKDFRYFQDTFIMDLVLNPLAVNALIELRPIYFQQSKATILSQSFEELNRLAEILKENPKMHIRVEGHTDNLGREEDLLRLSQDRADAIKDFLMEKGITKNRVETLGYGAKFPINENKGDEERSKNRRVEVRITKV